MARTWEIFRPSKNRDEAGQQESGYFSSILTYRIFFELSGQFGKIRKCSGWGDAQFVRDDGIAIEPVGAKAERSCAGDIPIVG